MVSEATPDSSVGPTSAPSENSPAECIDSVMLSLQAILDSNPAAALRFYALFDLDSGQQPMLANFAALQDFVPTQLSDEISGEEKGLVLQAVQELRCALEAVSDLGENERKLAFELFKARATMEVMFLVTMQVTLSL